MDIIELGHLVTETKDISPPGPGDEVLTHS